MNRETFHDIVNQALDRHEKDFGHLPERMFLIADDCVIDEHGIARGNSTAASIAAEPADLARMIETSMKTPNLGPAIFRGVAVRIATDPEAFNRLRHEVEEVQKLILVVEAEDEK